jgi:hypothetical protein
MTAVDRLGFHVRLKAPDGMRGTRKGRHEATPARGGGDDEKSLYEEANSCEKIGEEEDVSEKGRVKTQAVGKKIIGAKTVSALNKRVRYKRQSLNTLASSRERPGASSGGPSGDLPDAPASQRRQAAEAR